MIDLSPIQKYIDELDSFMTSFVPHEIQSIGLDSFLEYNFHSLDCTRVCKDGLRPMQTIGYPYRHTITETVFTIKNYVEEDKQDKYFERLLKRHSYNLEYEQYFDNEDKLSFTSKKRCPFCNNKKWYKNN